MKPFALVLCLLLAAWLALALLGHPAQPKFQLQALGTGIYLGNDSDVELKDIILKLDRGSPVALEALQAGDSITIPYRDFGTSQTAETIAITAKSKTGEVFKMVKTDF